MASSCVAGSERPSSGDSQDTLAAGRPRSATHVATTDSGAPSSSGAGPADTYTLGSTEEEETEEEEEGREKRREEKEEEE